MSAGVVTEYARAINSAVGTFSIVRPPSGRCVTVGPKRRKGVVAPAAASWGFTDTTSNVTSSDADDVCVRTPGATNAHTTRAATAVVSRRGISHSQHGADKTGSNRSIVPPCTDEISWPA